MIVSPYQLKEGCILLSDLHALTNTAIIPKQTVLTNLHIDVIKAFLIKEVEVAPTLHNGQPFKIDEAMPEQDDKTHENLSFYDQYTKAVTDYKRLFQNWQAGALIDIAAVRAIVVPLIETAVLTPVMMFKLHHFVVKEDYLYHHAMAMAIIAATLGHTMQYQKSDWIQVGLTAALSDCGMAKIDAKLLTKVSRLSNAEFKEIKQHPTHSYHMLKQVAVINDSVKLAVLQHHERLDGSGYPLAFTAEKLHPYGKIIAVADIFHAMTSERHFQPKQSPFKVLETIMQDNFGKYDVTIVKALTTILTNFSTRAKVKLSNKRIGEILFIESNHPVRPMVKLEDGEIIQLSKHKDIYIDELYT